MAQVAARSIHLRRHGQALSSRWYWLTLQNNLSQTQRRITGRNLLGHQFLLRLLPSLPDVRTPHTVSPFGKGTILIGPGSSPSRLFYIAKPTLARIPKTSRAKTMGRGWRSGWLAPEMDRRPLKRGSLLQCQRECASASGPRSKSRGSRPENWTAGSRPEDGDKSSIRSPPARRHGQCPDRKDKKKEGPIKTAGGQANVLGQAANESSPLMALPR